jgi:tetratricopeptide (TPR) repeat protein
VTPSPACAGLSAGIALLLSLFAAISLPAQQHTHSPDPNPPTPPDLKAATLLIREGRTAEARERLSRLLTLDPSNAEAYYQMARAHLVDFHSKRQDPERAHTALNLALEALDNALRRSPDHIPALKSKAVIHARAELLHYDPNLAYQLAARVMKLQPHATEYVLNLTEWLSGEVRFTVDSEHRVPHDPATGIDRAIEILDRLIDLTSPFSPEDYLALFTMGKAQAKRGNFAESVNFFQMALNRSQDPAQRAETLQELGVSYYRMGDYGQAGKTFYEAVRLRPRLLEQWLLKVALDRWSDPPPPLPDSYRFPTRELKIDPAVPPPLSFQDVAEELGLDRLDGNGTCAWGDYNGDGKLDLLLAGSGTFLSLRRQTPDGRFVEATAESGLDRIPSGYSLNFVDYDNDGRLDIYVSLNGWSGPMKNRLLRNAGNGRFEDVSDRSGAGDPGSGFVSLWGDLDNDGDLDLVVANGVLKDGSVPQIYRNNGDATFTNVTHEAGLREPPTFGAIGIALGDYDLDGDLDLFINGLETAPNRLYRNDGDLRFTEVSRESRVVQPPHNGFVSFFFDYNNDGWPDLLTTSLAPWNAVLEGLTRWFRVPKPDAIHPDSSRLFRNNRNGTFTDVTWEAKLFYPMGVMGAGVADLDNDGYMDLYFGAGDPQLSRLEPNRFFRNNGDGTFSDLTDSVGFARPGNKGHGVCFVDIDEDGDLDVYAQLGGHYPGDHARNAFYRNRKGNQNNWLQVDLHGRSSNRYAIGARLVAKAGGLIISREVKGSEGFGSTNPYRVHFGLGRHTRIDSLEIFWPSGNTQRLDHIRANQLVEVTEP